MRVRVRVRACPSWVGVVRCWFKAHPLTTTLRPLRTLPTAWSPRCRCWSSSLDHPSTAHLLLALPLPFTLLFTPLTVVLPRCRCSAAWTTLTSCATWGRCERARHCSSSWSMCRSVQRSAAHSTVRAARWCTCRSVQRSVTCAPRPLPLLTVQGGSISSLLSRFGSLKESVICVYTRQLLCGLAYLHAQRTVHRGGCAVAGSSHAGSCTESCRA